MDSFSHNFLLHNYYSINLWKNLPCTQKSRPSWLSFAAGMDGDTEWTALFETLIGSWADNVYFCVYLDKIKALEIVMISRAFAWSRWQDLNLRPFGPEPNALPNCATPRMEPMWGFEPQTCALRVRRSTYWATLALPTVHKYSIKNLFCHYFFQKKHDIFHIFFVETFLLKIRVSCASTQ